jgi:hypothetical protein
MTSTPVLDDSFCDRPNTCMQFLEGRKSAKICMKLRFTSRILKQHYFVVVITERKFRAFFYLHCCTNGNISVSKLMYKRQYICQQIDALWGRRQGFNSQYNHKLLSSQVHILNQSYKNTSFYQCIHCYMFRL